MPISSVLKTGIKSLPEDTVVPAQSVPNMLKKLGVKDEELEFSGVQLPKEGRVTKADLEEMESKRLDIFDYEETSNFNWVSLAPGRNNPTYKEKVLTYSQAGAQPEDDKSGRLAELLKSTDANDQLEAEQLAYELGWDGVQDLTKMDFRSSRYTSTHFMETPNYLMHTRIYDDTIDGIPTRVVQEIQSDLHQQGRKQGYGARTLAENDRATLELAMGQGDDLDAIDEAQEASFEILERYGMTGDPIEEIPMLLERGTAEGGIPKSPFEKTWLRKGLEREIHDAIKEGRGQIAIPISGAVENLKRAPGVQKWYETTVLSTAKKLAKSAGMDFEMIVEAVEVPKDVMERAIALGYDETSGTPIASWAEPLRREIDARRDTSTELEQYAEDLANLVFDVQGTGAGTEVTYAIIKPRDLVVNPTTGKAARRNMILADLEGLDDLKQAALDLGYEDDFGDIVTWSENRARYLLEEEAADPEAVEEASKHLDLIDGVKGLVKKSDGDYGKTPDFALYASPGASAFIAYAALKEGYAQEDIEAKLASEGYDEADIMEIMQNTQIVAEAKAAGYTDQDIKKMLEQQEVQVEGTTTTPIAELEPEQPGRVSQAYADLMGAEEMTVKDLVAKMETVYPDNSFVTTNIAGFFGNQEAKRISDESVAAQRNRIVAEAQKRGLDIRWDEESSEWMAATSEGEVIVTPEWYRSFWEAKGEFVLGFTGGWWATKEAIKRAPGGVKGKVVAGLGVLGATAAAAVAGTELDYLHNAMMLQQDFEGEAMARKAFTAAELSVIGDSVALGLIKVAGKSWNGMKDAVELIRSGYLDRANTALKETFFITDETADELVRRLSRVADIPAQSDVDRAITGVALTRPGGEELVAASVHTDPRASRAVVKAIDDRAKDLLSSTKELEGEGVGRFLRDELEGYTAMVRDNFERVKAQAAAAPRSTNFQFDYDKLALDPVLKRLGDNIENKDLAFKFAKQAMRIRKMSKSRRLGDLIELRKLVNEFRYNKRISNAKDFDMLDSIKSDIDVAIRQGAYATMENPQRWLAEWKTANRQYSEMKSVQSNALFKVLNRPGVSEKAIGQALAKYAPALDGTFVDVMAKLPKKTRMRAEGAVLNTLADKYTAGAVDGVKATDFPGLAKELDEITMTSPEARKMKKAIRELAQVFKNDQPLSQASGGIQVQKFAQALTTDPVAKAKFALASHMFHYVRSLAPTSSGRASALIVKTASVLENPVNSKTIRELTEMLDGEVNVSAEVNELVKQATLQKASGGGMPRMKLYGDGKVLSMKGTGTERSIPMHLIAPTEEVRRIAEAAGVNLADKKALDYLLRDYGYEAVQLGENKVRLLSE